MKFLLDMNMPPSLGPMLAAAGHEWRHAAGAGMSRANDAAILGEAKAQGECVITHDLDYGQLLAFSGDSRPSAIIFRLRRADRSAIFRRIADTWTEIEEPLKRGAIVTMEEAAMRIRRLPIARI
ncbi:MAG: DUF5615 family PIN-like protein [Candidatus Binataceae bacterium]